MYLQFFLHFCATQLDWFFNGPYFGDGNLFLFALGVPLIRVFWNMFAIILLALNIEKMTVNKSLCAYWAVIVHWFNLQCLVLILVIIFNNLFLHDMFFFLMSHGQDH
ncbi:hypothetical protein ACJX0J_034388 [Zea mays]